MEGGQATAGLAGSKVILLLTSPTSSQPSAAQYSTVMLLEVVLVSTASPVMDVPAITRVWAREIRIVIGVSAGVVWGTGASTCCPPSDGEHAPRTRPAVATTRVARHLFNSGPLSVYHLNHFTPHLLRLPSS